MTPTVQQIALEEIRPSKTNPRRVLNGPAFDELIASVKAHGILQPVLVRPNGKGYELVAGHRRLAAAAKAELALIPALVRELTDTQALEIQLIENLERSDLHPLEEAQGYRQLMVVAKYDVARIAEKIGRSVKYVYDRVKLLQLTKEAQKLFLEDRITAGHAILLARLKAADQKRAMDTKEARNSYGRHSALWQSERTLFDLDDETYEKRLETDPFMRLKVRTVRELQGWIDEHVRFDPKEPDPILFPETKAELEGAKKIIPITHSNYIPEEAREGRTFGPRSWARADGEQGSKTCEYSVTGFVAVGRDRGEAFAVCVNKDKCAVHWPAQVKARKRRAAGQKAAPAKPAAPPKRDKLEVERKKRDEVHARWNKALPAILEAVAERVKKASPARGSALCNLLVDFLKPREGKAPAKYVELGSHADDVVRFAAWLVIYDQAHQWLAWEHFPKLADKLGVDVRKILKAEAPVEKPAKGKPTPGTCSECGCTEDNACISAKTGETCGWANKQKTLCSFCTVEKPAKSGSGKTRAKEGRKK